MPTQRYFNRASMSGLLHAFARRFGFAPVFSLLAMKKVLAQLLLSFALIVQGSVGAFGATLSMRGSAPCCPHVAAAQYAHSAAVKPECPGHPHSACNGHCVPACASCAALALIAVPIAAIDALAVTLPQLAQPVTAPHLRAHAPPTRPPIA